MNECVGIYRKNGINDEYCDYACAGFIYRRTFITAH